MIINRNNTAVWKYAGLSFLLGRKLNTILIDIDSAKGYMLSEGQCKAYSVK